MSYRFRFIKANKSNLSLRDCSVEELKTRLSAYYTEDEDYFAVYDMFQQTEVFDFATLDFVSELLKASEPFFKDKCTDEYFEHYNIKLCSKETFELAIDGMRKHILEYFKDLRNKKPEVILAHLESKIEEWQPLSETLGFGDEKDYTKLNSEHFPYDMDVNKPNIVTSWLYEYLIFELVRLYKGFDWDNDILMLYGW